MGNVLKADDKMPLVTGDQDRDLNALGLDYAMSKRTTAYIQADLGGLSRDDVPAMFRFDPALKVYLHREPVDGRKAINGLALLVEQALGLDPFAPALFVFSNRRRDRIKILLWERTGFWLMIKRLEADRFKWPKDAEVRHAQCRAIALAAGGNRPGGHAPASGAKYLQAG
jgi:transposase